MHRILFKMSRSFTFGRVMRTMNIPTMNNTAPGPASVTFDFRPKTSAIQDVLPATP